MKTDTNYPLSTYRIQFNDAFTFAHLEEILDYLQQLGITTIYASPIFDAVPGSQHGYDGIAPYRINPAIGTLDDLRRISASLRQRGMTWIQDIVPNHMALHPGNEWLMDVLERGPVSPWYHFFDIDWEYHDPQLHGRLMVPFLDRPLPQAISEKQITFTAGENGFQFNTGSLAFPLSVTAYDVLLDTFEDAAPEIRGGLLSLQQNGRLALPPDEWRRQKQTLFNGLLQTPALTAFLENVNNHEALLNLLLEQQYYLFTHWQETAQRINYRRFFTINGLITLRMEDKQVFDTWHSFAHELYRENLIQGLRIDHIDGLMEPGTYVRRLRELFGDACYIIAEKILGEEESLPAGWGLDGTTGYEFLSDVNHLLTNKWGDEKISRFYRAQFPELARYPQLVQNKKTMILQTQLSAEWDHLVYLLYHYRLVHKSTDRQKLKAALGLWMVCMPVYRIYPESWPLPDNDIIILEEAITAAVKRTPALTDEFALFRSWWKEEAGKPAVILKFLKRLMQFTGPLTAKGVEDTVFYVYNALLSHNEVGDSPAGHKCTPLTFHERSIKRQQQFPGSLNATATHDTKRGEDARIRLNVLTLLPDLWIQQVQQWYAMNSAFREENAPTKNDEYFIYQSIIAGYPERNDPENNFIPRLSAYLIKALRESKEHSDWSQPDEGYENSCINFIHRLFSPGHGFMESLHPFMEKINQHAQVYSLSQLLVKITSPGIPDIYQGCELWDFSFVDPDNRQPVNYPDRINMLSFMLQLEKDDPAALMKLLNDNRRFAWEKLFTCTRALQFRKTHAALFQQGAYLPLSGEQDPVIAYARQHEHDTCLVIAPLLSPGNFEQRWLPLDNNLPQQWRDIFTGETVTTENGKLPLAVLDRFPVALLEKISG